MLYALYVTVVSAFAGIAALGHVLLFKALYPKLFGTPQGVNGETIREGVGPAAGGEQPHTPKLAA